MKKKDGKSLFLSTDNIFSNDKNQNLWKPQDFDNERNEN